MCLGNWAKLGLVCASWTVLGGQRPLAPPLARRIASFLAHG